MTRPQRWLISISALATLCLSAATAPAQQAARYSNPQYGISFQPPAGWVEDRTIGPEAVVQYVGPPRPDGTRPAMNLIVQNSSFELNDQEIGSVVKGIEEDFTEQGLRGAQIADYHKRAIPPFEALQVDILYKIGSLQTRLRQVMVPIAEHKRTYILNLVDSDEHFQESAPVAEAAFVTFTAAVTRAPAPRGAGAPATGSGGPSTVVLILIGALALAVIVASAYLLLRRRNA